MKKFYTTVNYENVYIYPSVAGIANSLGGYFNGSEIYYIDENIVSNLQNGTNYTTGATFSQLNIFGSVEFNMLNDPIVVTSIIDSFPSGTTNGTSWYLISSLATGSGISNYKNNLLFDSVTGGTAHRFLFLKPFNGLNIQYSTNGNSYEWDVNYTSSTQWKSTVPIFPIRWNDLQVPILSTKVAGAKDPTFGILKSNGTGSNGVFTYFFSPTAENELYFTAQLPHDYIQGTDLEPHFHWSPINYGSGSVVWGLEYAWASPGATYGNSEILTAIGTSRGIPYQHIITGVDAIMNGTGKGISSMIIGRIFRDATNPLDNYGTGVALLAFDFHYQLNEIGSIYETHR